MIEAMNSIVLEINLEKPEYMQVQEKIFPVNQNISWRLKDVNPGKYNSLNTSVICKNNI